MRDQWEVRVQENIGGWNVLVWLISRDYKPSVAYFKDGAVELVEIVEGKEMNPTLTLNRDIWEALKHSMTENHERDKATVESELNATKYHLEDMRKLALKTKSLASTKERDEDYEKS